MAQPLRLTIRTQFGIQRLRESRMYVVVISVCSATDSPIGRLNPRVLRIESDCAPASCAFVLLSSLKRFPMFLIHRSGEKILTMAL